MCQLPMFTMSVAYVCSVYSLCFVAYYSCGACASQLLLFCLTIVSIVLHRCGHGKITCMNVKNMLCIGKEEGNKSEEREGRHSLSIGKKSLMLADIAQFP